MSWKIWPTWPYGDLFFPLLSGGREQRAQLVRISVPLGLSGILSRLWLGSASWGALRLLPGTLFCFLTVLPLSPSPSSPVLRAAYPQAGVSLPPDFCRQEPGIPDTHFLFWIRTRNYPPGSHSSVATPVHPGRKRMCSDNEGNGKQETRRVAEEVAPLLWVSPPHLAICEPQEPGHQGCWEQISKASLEI